MRIIKSGITIFLVLFFFNFYAKAKTEKLDNLAACAGVVIGNGAVDFYLGNEQSFDIAANIALGEKNIDKTKRQSYDTPITAYGGINSHMSIRAM